MSPLDRRPSRAEGNMRDRDDVLCECAPVITMSLCSLLRCFRQPYRLAGRWPMHSSCRTSLVSPAMNISLFRRRIVGGIGSRIFGDSADFDGGFSRNVAEGAIHPLAYDCRDRLSG